MRKIHPAFWLALAFAPLALFTVAFYG